MNACKMTAAWIISKPNDQELKMPIGDAISFFQVTTVRSATPGVVMFLTSDL